MKTLTAILMASALLAPIVSANDREEVDRAATTIGRMQRMPDRGIPRRIMRGAKGFAIMRVYKAGLGISGSAGDGVVVARTKNGWSGPAFIGIGGVGGGPQVGAEATDFVFVLNSRSAVDAFSHRANLTLGGDVSVTTGPVGRNAEVGVMPVAAVYSYSQSKGLFLGASVEGAVIGSRPGANEAFYGREVSPGAILSGKVKAPRAAAPLFEALGNPGYNGKRVAQR